jgi:hypothetical protein
VPAIEPDDRYPERRPPRGHEHSGIQMSPNQSYAYGQRDPGAIVRSAVGSYALGWSGTERGHTLGGVPGSASGHHQPDTRGMTCLMAYPGHLAVDLPDHDPWEKENHGCFVSS